MQKAQPSVEITKVQEIHFQQYCKHFISTTTMLFILFIKYKLFINFYKRNYEFSYLLYINISCNIFRIFIEFNMIIEYSLKQDTSKHF